MATVKRINLPIRSPPAIPAAPADRATSPPLASASGSCPSNPPAGCSWPRRSPHTTAYRCENKSEARFLLGHLQHQGFLHGGINPLVCLAFPCQDIGSREKRQQHNQSAHTVSPSR